MADLGKIISAKSAADTQWREQRQAERESVTAMQDAGVTEITNNPEVYARYLDMQGDNPTYSAGNIALVMMQSQTATIFGTPEKWKTQGRVVLDTERAKGVQIFSRPPLGRGYTISDAYDIKQTQGRELKRPQLQDDTKEMEAALKVVLNYAVVPVVADEELPVAAYYDQGHMELAINPNFPDSEAFAAIAAEIAHARLHGKGYNSGYNRDDCELDAQSVSYILCRRFGISRDVPDLSKLPELYGGWEAPDRRRALDSIQDMSKQIGSSIEKNIMPPQRNRPPVRRAAR
ncbi:MAG: hypothetical protein HFF49_01270 [Lawsonibacter sp.]|jgi:hypothetical protein|nr:hypothetical protein [Lawsonibacter sp.]